MVLILKILCINTYIISVSSAQELLTVNETPPVVAVYQETVVLHCTFQTHQENNDFKVKWFNNTTGSEALVQCNSESNGSYQTKQTICEEGPLHNTKLSYYSNLTIVKTEISDDGEFICQVDCSAGTKQGKFSVKVTAPYSEPEVDMAQGTAKEASTNISCKTSRGYPLGQIHWFDESGKNRTESAVFSYTRTSEGLYNIVSNLTLSGHNSSKYNCTVWNERSGISISREYTLNYLSDHDPHHGDESNRTKAVIIVFGALACGAGILLCGFVTLFTWRRLKKSVNRRYCAP
ncbi:programmed cell death 1 ligand 2-like [Latimeria chalumnae]|uniref:programmed cell death 1 ligand 2-like n=1 Tax=Latimeria chalumnae TaxID=7897 RepID=UPI0003C156A9|nr:PREDICTED: programmed cell death 1 ligand 2-like [Latimeria chalumnae]XP_005998596.1 PREDICTED: programmed cell death 1 ligand 2-like [Latimeria chalumnae]|eukprot:XP_005998595.1 PREDICTED: programmed cell death 1 ligand 2-like [Latimeria chalumnae]